MTHLERQPRDALREAARDAVKEAAPWQVFACGIRPLRKLGSLAGAALPLCYPRDPGFLAILAFAAASSGPVMRLKR